MNLYKLHSNPEVLDHNNEQYKMPGNAWGHYIQALKNKDTKAQNFYWPWIVKDPESAYLCTVWQGTEIPALENTIMWDAEFARKYATNVMQRRWPEAEDMIFSDRIEGMLYSDEFELD